MKFLQFGFFLLTLFCCHMAAANQQVWVIVNNNYKGNISLNIKDDQPCLPQNLLEEWGIHLPQQLTNPWTSQGCLAPHIFKQLQFQYWYKPEARLLTMLIPKSYINPRQNGVSTSRWDNGINAFFINYRANYSQLTSRDPYTETGRSFELELDNGINYGPWRLRYQNTLWRDVDGNHGIYTRSASLYRSINDWRTQLLIGDSKTADTLFDAIPFRGITLVTDEAMFPDSWRPFAPWISGYARSHAEVTISQNGLTVYRLHVPPGAFVIRDFYPPDREGMLELTVKESDGTESSRYLPWSAMPTLVHQGNFSFELTGGKYRPWRGSELATPTFFQASLAQGIMPELTLYAGTQQAQSYTSYLAGAGFNLYNLGAFSTDVTWARYLSFSERYQGRVWRLRYAKAFFDSETSFSAQFRYYPSHQRYRSLEEKITQPAGDYDWLFDESKNRLLAQEYWINHYLGEDQSLSLSYSQQTWRYLPGHRRSFSLSYLATFGNLDLSVWLGRSRQQYSRSETTLGITLSLSLPEMGSMGSPSLNYGHNLASRSPQSQQFGVSGSALEDYSLRYEANATHNPHSADEYDASLSYQYNAGESGISFTHEYHDREYQLNVSGSVLFHEGGITLGQEMSDTMALLVVPDSPGIGNYQQFGVTTNAKGEALVGWLVPWRVNRLTLNDWQLPDNLTLPMTELETVPVKGAIIKAVFLPAEKKARDEK